MWQTVVALHYDLKTMDLLDLGSGDKKQPRHFLDDGSEDQMDSNCIQYRVTGGGDGATNSSANGALSYRVVSSEATEQTNGGTTTVNSANPLGNVQAVLASPLNGQFYVIGNPSDVLGGMGQRTIAPRAGPFTLEQNPGQNTKEDRQGTRRATHNEVERRRRDNINNWIMKLGKLLPDGGGSQDSSQTGSGKHAQSKGGILAKACEYLAETRNNNQRLVETIKQSEGITADNERLSAQVEQLQQENAILKQQLQNHGIIPQGQDIKFSTILP